MDATGFQCMLKSRSRKEPPFQATYSHHSLRHANPTSSLQEFPSVRKWYIGQHHAVRLNQDLHAIPGHLWPDDLLDVVPAVEWLFRTGKELLVALVPVPLLRAVP